jgi:hypothetical protein
MQRWQVKATEALAEIKSEGGFWRVDAWLQSRREYADLDRLEVARRARQISQAAGWFQANARGGGHVLTGRAIEMAAQAETKLRTQIGEHLYRRRLRDNEVSAFFRETFYEDVLLAFKSRGGSFEGWCRRMGFAERQARRAAQRPDSRMRRYCEIREALMEALAEIGQ